MIQNDHGRRGTAKHRSLFQFLAYLHSGYLGTLFLFTPAAKRLIKSDVSHQVGSVTGGINAWRISYLKTFTHLSVSALPFKVLK